MSHPDTPEHVPSPSVGPILRAILLLAALVAVPALGGWVFGTIPPEFSELPPVTVTIHPPVYSAPVYVVFLLPFVVAILVMARPAWFGFRMGPVPEPRADDGWWMAPRTGCGTWPWWGWVGLGLGAVSWISAWVRPTVLGGAADHTFFPLWLGYILTVDAWVMKRRGTSLLRARPRAWMALFPASAVSWWYYEYINRFIQNWVYEGIGHFTPIRYILGATLAFSTVLPAVLETTDLLGSLRWFQTAYARGPRIAPPPRVTAWGVALLGVLGLFLMPRFPIHLFWAAWLAPLGLLAGGLALCGVPTGFEPLRIGDARPILLTALATLICGFFWEMWNMHSLPRWIYQVPWANRFHIFEMPFVGYGGYLPFGPVCWLWAVLLVPGLRIRNP